MAGASNSLGTFSNKSKSSSYKMSKNKRDKKLRKKKAKIEDNDPEPADEFLLSGQDSYVEECFVSSPNSSPNENIRGRKRPKDSMAEELV